MAEGKVEDGSNIVKGSVKGSKLRTVKMGDMSIRRDIAVDYEVWVNNKKVKKGSTKLGEAGEIVFEDPSQDVDIVV